MTIGDQPAEDVSPLSMLMELIEEYGDFVRYRTHYGTFFLANRPALVREVLCGPDYVRNRLLKTVLGNGLLSSDGPHWEQQRRRMLPVFMPRQIDGMVDVFRRVTVERMETWERTSLPVTMDAGPEMFRIALSSVCCALFGAEFDDDGFLGALDCVMREVSAIQNAATFGFPLIRRASSQRQYRDAMRVIEEAARSLMTGRQHDASPQAKLLEVLQGTGRGRESSSLSDQDIRDEVLTMIVAGHETTAVALCWALQAIASHPEVAERLYAEVDAVLGMRPIAAADLPQFAYTRMVIDETLRLHPPVWIVARTAARDVELGGYHVPAGSGVLVSPFALHRHPAYWSDPQRFDPDRFAPQAKPPVPYTYLPFLAGRHLCLGKHFSLTEMVVVLTTLAQRFRFEPADDRPPIFEPLVSLRIRGGLNLRLEHRCPRCMA